MNSTTNLPLISVVIPNHNGSVYLAKCLQSLQAQTWRGMEIIVVDNASHDESIEVIRAAAPKAIVVQNNQNLGFAGGVNAGIQSAHGDWIAVLNNDTELPSSWLAECGHAIRSHPDAAFFACKIVDVSDRNRIFSAGDCYLRGGIGYRRGQELRDRPEFRKESRIFSACGCAALYRRDILRELGGFDDRFFAYLEDVDLGLRLQTAGYHGFYLPQAEVFHHGAATSGGEFSPLSVRLRTRNSLLLLLKSVPGELLFRCLPMILFLQLSWAARVLAHGKLGSYLRGLWEAVRMAPVVIKARAGMRLSWKRATERLWQDILESESQARSDFFNPEAGSQSLFLKWYFRIF